MRLPNNKAAYVPREKLIAYLLSETHSVGKSKAKVLRAVGFDEMNVGVLEGGLLAIAHHGDIVDTESSIHGVKYVIEGLLQTPNGGALRVRTIWIIDKGQERPRFVTAYPV